jgi:MazG family protein
MSETIAFSPRVAGPTVDVQPFVDLVATLRSPVGCAWDRAQTNVTVAPFTVEETFELVEAIRSGDDTAILEELGDVLLQVVLHAQIASDRGSFTLQDVVNGITTKMVSRHAHVFGEESALDAAAVRASWARSKRREGRSTLGGIPAAMPALERADRIARRAASVGFDWPDAAAVCDKLDEECGEVREALASGDNARAAEEVGDVLFAAVSLAIHVGSDASAALDSTLRRFTERFAAVERAALAGGLKLEDLTPHELDDMWRAAKHEIAQRDEVSVE